MALIKVIKNQRFELCNQRISYVFQISPEGLLEHIYFGEAIELNEQLPAKPRRVFRSCTLEFEEISNYNLNDIAQEYPLFGNTDCRTPALHCINTDGNSDTLLRYQSYEILVEKPRLENLPQARQGNSETLAVTLVDDYLNIQVVLFYTLYADHDVVVRSAKVINNSDSDIQLNQVLSSNLDLPADDYELLHLGGSWSREVGERRQNVTNGLFNISSRAGTSSNIHNPFMAVMSTGTSEISGDIISTALMYSGNFIINVERNEFDSVRFNVGINPFDFTWQLKPNTSFQSPEAILSYSNTGLRGMSQQWHTFSRANILPSAFHGQQRPSYLNTWEALYFDVSETKVMELAHKAKSLGLDMLVLDDGWFNGRNDDHSSLGDWYADSVKFPHGIESVAKQVNELGLKFGLWFEPEMVNEDSDLFRTHLNWVIQVPQRKASTGRNQLTLDLSQPAVVDYLFERIDSFLSCGHIQYVKWDMNRIMSNVGSTALAYNQQKEVTHRYMLGLYGLVAKITEKYPTVLFENCASGGNRFDYGMLNFMAQGWVSDMSDPIGRLDIINGASYLFPTDVLTSYIGPVPNHQNGRVSSLALREDVGFFAVGRGLSLSMADINADVEGLKSIIQRYNNSAENLINANFYRLKHTDNEVIWQLTSANGEHTYVGYFVRLSSPNLPLRRIKLASLVADADYHLTANHTDIKHRNAKYIIDSHSQSAPLFKGSALMGLGIDLPYICSMQPDVATDYMPMGDFSSRIMYLARQ